MGTQGRRPILRRGFGPHVNEGQRRLWLVLVERGLTQKQLGEPVAAADGLVNRWLYGEQKPGLKFAPGLAEHYGIEITAWNSAPEGEFPLPELTEFHAVWRAAQERTGTDDS